jgi:hypothetical protein
LERVHRGLDLAVSPDEDDVEHDEQDEPRYEPGTRRQRRDNACDREAGAPDQGHAGGIAVQSIRTQPRERVEGRHDQHGRPRKPPATGPARTGREHGGRERGEGRQEVGAAARLCEGNADDERSGRDREPEHARGTDPPRASGHDHQRGLDEHEHGV